MSPRVEAIEASEFAIAFASYIEGDAGVRMILVVTADSSAASGLAQSKAPATGSAPPHGGHGGHQADALEDSPDFSDVRVAAA